MQSLTSIVVGIDFTPGSRAALLQALRIARWTRAGVTAVHVIDTLVAEELEEALAGVETGLRDTLAADARKAWAPFVAGIEGAAGVTLDVRIQGRVAGVLDAARGAGLLVLGAYGDRAPEVGAGTIATACVRQAACPVLLVRDTHEGPFRRVVACVDFSDASRQALDQAARVATQDSAALHVLHVFRAPWHELHYRSPTPQAEPHFRQQYTGALERRLRAFAGELGRPIDDLKPEFAVFDHRGHRSGIVEYAQRVGADLVVLARRGRGGLREALLGSTAEKALRDSACSVLVVRG